MSNNKEFSNQIEIWEFQTLQAPREELNKIFRHNHRIMETEITQMCREMDKLEKATHEDNAIISCNMLDDVIEKFKNMKRKIDEGQEKQLAWLCNCVRCLQHVKDMHELGISQRIDAKTASVPCHTKNSQSIFVPSGLSQIRDSSFDMCCQENDDETDFMLPTYDALYGRQKRDEFIFSAPALKRRRIDKFIVNHLLHSGYFKSALAYASKTSVETYSGAHLVKEFQTIAESISVGDTSPVIQWCSSKRSKLQEIESIFEFEVRLFQFFKLVTIEKDCLSAVRYAREHLGPAVSKARLSSSSARAEQQQMQESNNFLTPDSHISSLSHGINCCAVTSLPQSSNMSEHHQVDCLERYLRSAMSLLTKPTSSLDCPYLQTCSTRRFDAEWLIQRFKTSFCLVYEITSPSLLSIAIQTGLSVLKHYDCYSSNKRNVNCPVCSPLMNSLAVGLPFSKPAHSRLTCPLSGQVMNEENSPMMVPDGRVFSYNALQSLIQKGKGNLVKIPAMVKCDNKGNENIITGLNSIARFCTTTSGNSPQSHILVPFKDIKRVYLV